MSETNSSSDAESFDYVIVGAGSAGCVLASRLTEDPGVTVLLLEAGGDDNGIFINMPAALSIPMNMDKYNWRFETEPEPYLGGRRMHCPRGKLLGGSSSINGMCWVRGNPMDYESWVMNGATGWSYADVLPYFRKAETYNQGADAYRGSDGPISVLRGEMKSSLYRAFVEAGVQAGYPRTDDMNGGQQEGFGAMDMNVANGSRCSAARAYIHPAKNRKNLKVMLGVHVERIALEGRKATGVHYLAGNQQVFAKAKREVIVSCGAIGSPHLLKVSGIGPASELNEHGIPVVHDLPGVGENLMDHLELWIQESCIPPISLYKYMNPLRKLGIGVRWMLFKSGMGATNHFEAGGHIRSRPGIPYPDIQFHFLPIAISYDGNSLPTQHGYQVHVGTKRSKSRGRVGLRSNDIRIKPSVLFNYMSHEDDWLEMRLCVKYAQEIFAQPAFDPFRGKSIAPPPEASSGEALDEFIRQNVESALHPSCTCRIGNDELAVVDPECRVRGIDSLRVIDSSVMPHATAGDLNAPTIMLAEKAADFVKGVTPLHDADASFYKAPDWETRQRPNEPLQSG